MRPLYRFLYKRFDYRFLYLILSENGRKGVKIGIGWELESRFRTIDRSLPGTKERIGFAVRLFYSKKHEGFLHSRFAKANFIKSGSGATEWFYLTERQYRQAVGWLKMYQAKQRFLLLLLALSLLFTLIVFIKLAPL